LYSERGLGGAAASTVTEIFSVEYCGDVTYLSFR